MVKKAGEELEAFFKESWAKHDVDATAKLMSKEKKVLTREDEMMKECDRIVHFLKKPGGVRYVWGLLHDGVPHSDTNCTRWVWYDNCEGGDANHPWCRRSGAAGGVT